MTPKNFKNNVTYKRTDQEWIDELSGKCGGDKQWLAHEDLGRYLYRIALNNLKKRQDNVPMLRALAYEELTSHVQDFVQLALEKLARNDFALLDQFSGAGSFTSWAAQVINRQISSELRKAHWQRTDFLESFASTDWLQSKTITPEAAILQLDLREQIKKCLERLPERNFIAFVRCVVEGERPKAVAVELGITTNALYLLIHRAKIVLRGQLSVDGYGVN